MVYTACACTHAFLHKQIHICAHSYVSKLTYGCTHQCTCMFLSESLLIKFCLLKVLLCKRNLLLWNAYVHTGMDTAPCACTHTLNHKHIYTCTDPDAFTPIYGTTHECIFASIRKVYCLKLECSFCCCNLASIGSVFIFCSVVKNWAG